MNKELDLKREKIRELIMKNCLTGPITIALEGLKRKLYVDYQIRLGNLENIEAEIRKDESEFNIDEFFKFLERETFSDLQ